MPRSDNTPDPQRQLMIKTKTCQRLQKEVLYYQKEVQENEEKLREMKAATDRFDSYDIKRFQQVLDESYMMVPDSQKRFQQSIEDLKNFVQQLQDESQDSGTKAALEGDWYTTATALLQDQNAAGTADEGGVPAQTDVDHLAAGETF